MARIVALFALATLFAAACTQSQIVDPQANAPDADPCIADFRKKLDEDPEKCAHVWQQVGVHPYQRMVNGVPVTSLCTITRCTKCGTINHECWKYQNRAKHRTRTPRSKSTPPRR